MGFLNDFKANNPNEKVTRLVNIEWVLSLIDKLRTLVSALVSKTANGLTPQLPNETTTTKFFRQDGSWVVPPDTDTVYVHPSGDGNNHVPSGGSDGQILRWSSDGTATWGADNDTTYSEMSGTTLGLVKLNGNYTFTGTINVPTPALPG